MFTDVYNVYIRKHYHLTEFNRFARYVKENGITQPTRADIIAYRDELKATLKPATVKAYIVAVRLFFQWTYQEGLYPNIAEHIKGVKIDIIFSLILELV